jgi:predicted nuclease with TOPRIM domain
LNGFAAHVIASGTGKTYMSYIPDRKIMELSRQINEAREKFEKVAAERDALRDDLAAARALLIAAATFVPAHHEMQARIDAALAGKDAT